MTKQDPAQHFTYAGVMPDAASVDFLIEQSSDIAIHIDADGVIRGIYVNPENPSLGSLDHWVGRVFEGFLTEEGRIKFAQRLEDIRANPNALPRPIELTHLDNASWEFPIRYAPIRVRRANALLLVGRDLQPIAEVQQRLVNEQLARDRDLQKLRGAETFYRIILEVSETPLVIIDPSAGRIRDMNSAAADILGAKVETLVGTALNQAFEGMPRSDLIERLESASEAEAPSGVEVVARRSGKSVALIPQYFRAAGELVLLCRLLHLTEGKDDSTEITQSLTALFHATSDAIVILDSKGFIREANEAFLVLADAARLKTVQDKSFSELLQRGDVDLRLLLEGARQEGRLRSFAAQFRSVVGTRTRVDISSSLLRLPNGETGVGLIIRDASQESRADDDLSRVGVSEEAVKSVMDLVGTASLKELVSATSDVIERMCIETALQLTNNNRVATAEMLGLSRQSLYVKLRKFNLLDSDQEP